MSFQKFSELIDRLKKDDNLFYCGKVPEKGDNSAFAITFNESEIRGCARAMKAEPGDIMFCTAESHATQQFGEIVYQYNPKEVYCFNSRDMVMTSYAKGKVDTYNCMFDELPVVKPTEADNALFTAATLEDASEAVNQGARINILNQEGYSPLLAHSMSGHGDIVRYLVNDCGACVWNPVKNQGASADMIADYQGHYGIKNFLRQYKEHHPIPHQEDVDKGVEVLIKKSMENMRQHEPKLTRSEGRERGMYTVRSIVEDAAEAYRREQNAKKEMDEDVSTFCISFKGGRL